MIQIPIEIGDVIRVGKFKNKRITVKDITWDEYGLPQVNGKGIMKIRIEKLMPPKEPKQENNMINEQETDQDLIQNVIDTYNHTKSGKMALGGKREASKYQKVSEKTGFITVYSLGFNNYAVAMTDKGIQHFNLKRKNELTMKPNKSNLKKINESIDYESLIDDFLTNPNKKQVFKKGSSEYSDLEKLEDSISFDRFENSLIKSGLELEYDDGIDAYIIFKKKSKTYENLIKPNKAKLDRMITSILKESFHPNDTQVKIKQKDKLWWICQEETDECLNAVGFDSKEAAEHSALTKGYSFPKSDEMNEMEPEVLTTKKEKVKGVDKVEDMKLDKEKEIKLEILRIAKRVIQEELKKKIRINELEVTDPSIVKKIEEMARLSDEMDRMANEMAKLKKQFAPLDEEITKLMEETAATGDRAIETQTILITIKKEGYEAKSPKYKESFEKLYAKVNATMKKQADEILAANTSIKKYSTTLAVQYKKTENKINEGMFSDLLNKVKSYFSGLYSKIVNLGKQADVEINNLKRLSSL